MLECFFEQTNKYIFERTSKPTFLSLLYWAIRLIN